MVNAFKISIEQKQSGSAVLAIPTKSKGCQLACGQWIYYHARLHRSPGGPTFRLEQGVVVGTPNKSTKRCEAWTDTPLAAGVTTSIKAKSWIQDLPHSCREFTPYVHMSPMCIFEDPVHLVRYVRVRRFHSACHSPERNVGQSS